MGKTIAMDIEGSSNVGLFAYTTDDYCLLGKGLLPEVKENFEKALDVPVHEITIGGSQQVGAYVNGNSKKLLVPNVITKNEEAVLEELGIEYVIVDTIHTALGNNLIVGEDFFFSMTGFEHDAIKQICEALGIENESLRLEEWEVIGSIVTISSKGGLVQKNVPKDVIKNLEEKLKVSLEPGTVNFGSHIIGGGIVVNKNGMIIGKASAGIEVTNADMAFGFLEK